MKLPAVAETPQRPAVTPAIPTAPLSTERHALITPTTQNRVRGSLLGGAIGDSSGAPGHFRTLADSGAQRGPANPRDDTSADGGGAITAATQLTLFTAEGTLRAWVRAQQRGICGVSGVIHHAYLRWLLTQGLRPYRADIRIGTDGWLFSTAALHSLRAPERTCLTALRNAVDRFGPDRAANASKGAGGVVRVAPIGLFAPAIGDDASVFRMAANAAALTHGHPTGFLTAGYLAVTIAALARGEALNAALDTADAQLRTQDNYTEISNALALARALAAQGQPRSAHLERLGHGWVAAETLAIAIYSALSASSFGNGVLFAAHDAGARHTAAAITGNLLGAQLGHAAIPPAWLAQLELHDEIDRLAHDLHAVAAGQLTATDAWDAYPGW